MRSKISLYLTLILIVALTLTGCNRPAAPDVTATPDTGIGGQGTPSGGTTEPTETGQPGEIPSPVVTEPPTPVSTESPTPVPTESPTPLPTESPTPLPTQQPTPAPTSAPQGGETVYVVQDGDNLFRIALKYNMDYNALARYNGITNPAMIYVGQKIKIPPASLIQPTPQPGGGATTYVVQSGDNLFRIALRYNMSYLYLAQYNNIPAPYIVYVGQVIKIPQP